MIRNQSSAPNSDHPSRLWKGGRAAGCAALVLIAGLVQADVLVTRDGQRIETQGAWEVKGRQVIFTSTSGTLSAVRLSEVDLDASELATNPPPPPPPPPAPVTKKEKREPVMVLTNENVGRAESIEDFASAFGGVMMDMQRAMAHGFAEMSDDPEATKQEIDEQLAAQEQVLEDGLRDLGAGLGEMAEVVTQVAEKYPALKDLNPEDPESIRRNADDIRAASAEIRSAAQHAKSDQAREMLNEAADQMDAKLKGQ